MEHTPTPWHAPGIGEICDQSGRVIAICIDCNPVEEALRPDPALDEAEANARRIVACINACAGLDTDYLENVGLPEFVGKTLCADLAQQELDAVTAQRDQLQSKLEAERASLFADNQRKQQLEQQVAELAGVLELCMSAVKLAGWEGDFCMEQARAVIQKVRGGEC